MSIRPRFPLAGRSGPLARGRAGLRPLPGRALRAGLALALMLAAMPAAAHDRDEVERRFRLWLEESLWPEARAAGVSRQTFEGALARVRLDWKAPGLHPPGAAAPAFAPQAEFASPGAYFKQNRLKRLVRLGRARLERWKTVLGRIERRYGVPRTIVVAIWGKESDFGRARIPHDALRVLATRAFMGRRREVFRPELVAALQMLEAGAARRAQMKSSWAGALGQPQLLPSKFRTYAVDFDGDGRRDVWDSVPDTLATIASVLRGEGWQRGRDWGFESVLPEEVPCTVEGPDRAKTIAEWKRLGVRRVAGRVFPAGELGKTGFLVMPAGRLGPAWIATANFSVLKAYNESDLYALFVGHLADRLRANRPFVQSWGRARGFPRRDVQQMQRRLEALGHDVGGADGLIGFKTRRAVGRWQQSHGLAPTCWPDAQLLKRIVAGGG